MENYKSELGLFINYVTIWSSSFDSTILLWANVSRYVVAECQRERGNDNRALSLNNKLLMRQVNERLRLDK